MAARCLFGRLYGVPRAELIEPAPQTIKAHIRLKAQYKRPYSTARSNLACHVTYRCNQNISGSACLQPGGLVGFLPDMGIVCASLDAFRIVN